MTEELKPCPFCGGEAKIIEWENDIYCGGCYVSMGKGANSLDEQIKLWNQRSSVIGTLKVKLSILDSEPMSELVEIICEHRDDMPGAMREKFVAWCDKHTTDKE